MTEKNFFAVIPAFVRYDRALNANAKLLYGEITALCNERGYCWASNDYFAALYGVSKKTVSTWISALESRGYIERKIVYKEGTKEIESRHIRLKAEGQDDLGKIGQPVYKQIAYETSAGEGPYGEDEGEPMEERTAYQEKCPEAMAEKRDAPMAEKVTDNTTALNKTVDETNKPGARKEQDSLEKIICGYTASGALRQCLRDFVKMRKAKKKPVTERAMLLLIKQLDQLEQSEERKIKVLEQSILNCWQGIFPLREEKGGKSYDAYGAGKDDGYNPFDM